MKRMLIIMVIAIAASSLALGQANPSRTLFPVLQNGKWGYINKSGNIVIKPQFDAANDFREGLAVVRNGSRETGKRGWINESGQVVIPLQYDLASYFQEGLAVANKGGMEGYIDKTGKVVIDFKYNGLKTFTEGLGAVKVGNQWGFMDKTGKVIIEPKFEEVLGFLEGLSAVKLNGLWGYINKTGKMVILPKYKKASSFVEGVAALQIPCNKAPNETPCDKFFNNGELAQYIDSKGNLLDATHPEIYEVNVVSDGLGRSVVLNSRGRREAEYYRFRAGDRKNVYHTPSKINALCYYFSEGVAPCQDNNTGKWGFIVMINPEEPFAWYKYIASQFDEVEGFWGGLARVKVGDKYGYIDKSERYVWQPTN